MCFISFNDYAFKGNIESSVIPNSKNYKLTITTNVEENITICYIQDCKFLLKEEKISLIFPQNVGKIR